MQPYTPPRRCSSSRFLPPSGHPPCASPVMSSHILPLSPNPPIRSPVLYGLKIPPHRSPQPNNPLHLVPDKIREKALTRSIPSSQMQRIPSHSIPTLITQPRYLVRTPQLLEQVRQEGGIVPTGGFEEEFAGGGALVFRVSEVGLGWECEVWEEDSG